MNICVRKQVAKNATACLVAILQDKRLSLKARGALACLLTLPEGETNAPIDLTTHSYKDGETAIRSALKELEDLGDGTCYLSREKFRNAKGQWEWRSLLHETPQPIPSNYFEYPRRRAKIKL